MAIAQHAEPSCKDKQDMPAESAIIEFPQTPEPLASPMPTQEIAIWTPVGILRACLSTMSRIGTQRRIKGTA